MFKNLFLKGIRKIKFIKTVQIMAFFVFISFFGSCVSLQDREMTGRELTEYKILGEVTAIFNSFHFLHIRSDNAIKKKAYNRLLEAAKIEYATQYGADMIDVRNIKIKCTNMGVVTMALSFLLFTTNIFYNDQQITATGDVVVKNEDFGTNLAISSRGIEGAVYRSSETLIARLPDGATIAILSIFSNEIETAEIIIGDLEFNLVNSRKFRIVDRRRLDQIRREQNFQLSGEVSDDSAVSIGNLLGATIVITGEISGSGRSQRLTIKALDVRSGQILAMTRESF